MSHIFDALQASETARTGSGERGPFSVTELLERAELLEIAKLPRDSTMEEWTQPSSPAGASSPTEGICSPLVPITIADQVAQQFESDGSTVFLEQFRNVEIAPSCRLRLASINDNNGPAAEAFRLLGIRLTHLRNERTLQKLLITSTVPQEGKTFTAANLAFAFPTRNKEKILLIDGDLRRISLSKMFQMETSPGLCEYLAGENDLASTIARLQGMDIWILPAGKTSANPLELIQSTKLPALIGELSARFDWIIIDSPPVLPLADTSAWARMADGILLVTRPGITVKRTLQAGVKAIEGQNLIGTVLNASSNTSAYYGYYGPSGN